MRLPSMPTVQTFKVELTYNGEPEEFDVTIRQATTGDVRERNGLFEESSWVLKDPTLGEQEIKSKWNPAQIAQFDAYKTVIDCTITKVVLGDDENVVETPWFEFEGTGSGRRAKSKATFFRAWDALPPQVSGAIYQRILLVNPQFGGAASEGESNAT